MNIWLITAFVLVLLLFPVLIASIRRRLVDRLIAMELGGIMASYIFIVLGVDSGQTIYIDVAIVILILSFGGGILYTRFLERWL